MLVCTKFGLMLLVILLPLHFIVWIALNLEPNIVSKMLDMRKMEIRHEFLLTFVGGRYN